MEYSGIAFRSKNVPGRWLIVRKLTRVKGSDLVELLGNIDTRNTRRLGRLDINQ